ncbi:UNVERIFIED_CONTAM: hypothetical protein FKN15_017100 [Acipenser sinensis]
MDITALTTLLQALEHRRETEERQREERYTALIERTADTKAGLQGEASADLQRTTSTSTQSTVPAPEHPVRNRVGSEVLFRDCNPWVLLLPAEGAVVRGLDTADSKPEPRGYQHRLSPQPGSPTPYFTPASSASITVYFPQHGHPNA